MRFSFILSLVWVLLVGTLSQAQTLTSPDGHTQLTLTNTQTPTWTVRYKGQTIVDQATAYLKLPNGKTLPAARKPKAKSSTHTGTMSPTYGIKKNYPNHYNQLRLSYKGGAALVFRLYNSGLAYRFETSQKNTLTIENEVAHTHLPKGHTLWVHPKKDNLLINSHETVVVNGNEITGKMAYKPVTAHLEAQGVWLSFFESDLRNYPGRSFTITANGFEDFFPKYPKKEKVGGFNDFNVVVPERHNYIATVPGTRTFPWRIMAIAAKPTQLLDNTLVAQLAKPCTLQTTNWIEPGLSAWEWWNNWNLAGVDFEAGINLQTYKYYIDFAAKNNIPYLTVDEGWSDNFDLLAPKPEVNIPEMVKYAKSKGVKLILWCVWHVLDKQLEPALDQMQQWGIAGVKVDFMDRDDQKVVNFYERVAQATAKRQMLVNYHGAYPPSGLETTYPNIITREGVLGNEYNKWHTLVTPKHIATLPFTRGVLGQMDFTPGAMRHLPANSFKPTPPLPQVQTTRAGQMALYVLFYSPLQYLCDSPTQYENNPQSLQMLRQMPTTWDQTLPLDGQPGEYVVVARQKGQKWYVGGFNGTEAAKAYTLNTDFLPKGSYKVTLATDGLNAAKNPYDVVMGSQTIQAGEAVQLTMAPGGGALLLIEAGGE